MIRKQKQNKNQINNLQKTHTEIGDQNKNNSRKPDRAKGKTKTLIKLDREQTKNHKDIIKLKIINAWG